MGSRTSSYFFIERENSRDATEGGSSRFMKDVCVYKES